MGHSGLNLAKMEKKDQHVSLPHTIELYTAITFLTRVLKNQPARKALEKHPEQVDHSITPIIAAKSNNIFIS